MIDDQGIPLDRLSAIDVSVVRECLTATVEGPFFPDWEFSLLFGLGREEVARVRERWPDKKCPKLQDVAVTNALNHLLFYPHRKWQVWGDFVSVEPEEVGNVLGRWVGEVEFDHSFDGYVDRILLDARDDPVMPFCPQRDSEFARPA